MLEHASSRAPLTMGRPVLLLVLLSAVWVVSVTARPSLRPSSPDEFRKLLLWAQKAAEHGELYPSFPSAEQLNEVDKDWTRTHRKGYLQDADLIGSPQRPYVETSDFRRRHPSKPNESSNTHQYRPRYSYSKVTSQPPATENFSLTTTASPTTTSVMPEDKRIHPEPIDLARSRPISDTLTYFTGDSPDSEMKLETLSHSIVYVNDPANKESPPKPEANTSREDSKAETIDIETLPLERLPPVFGHSLLSGASVSKLPSYEEYDRNERYSHSFLHGFSGF